MIVLRVINNGFKVGNDICKCVKKIMEEMGYCFNVNVWVFVIKCSVFLGVVIVEFYDLFFVMLVYGVEFIICKNNV